MAENTSQLSILVKVRDEASAALNRLSGDISDLGGSLNWASIGAGALAGGMAAIAGATLMDAIKEFADSEVQMARFNTIMKTLPSDLQKYREEILKTADASMKMGFDGETAAVAIARLFQATGNAELSFRAFQAAMDLARYKGISLEEATQALILAFQGGGRMLKQLGIEIDDHASKETILAAVMKATAGQAQAYSQTLNGVAETMKVYTGEVKKAIAQPFAELIKSIVFQLKDWIDAQGGVMATLDKFRWLVVVTGSVLSGVFVGGLIAATAAALGLAGPIGVITAAVMALIGAGSALYAAWATNFLGIRDVVVNAVNNMLHPIESLKRAVKSMASDVWGDLKSAGGIIGSALGSVKNFFGFAEGGIVTRPTLGLVGEAGPEAIIPLSKLGGAGIGGINIYLQGDFYTTDEVAERFANEIARAIKLQLRV